MMKSHLLQNGLELFFIPVEGAATIAIEALVGAGSYSPGSDGGQLAHLVEHLTFEGDVARREVPAGYISGSHLRAACGDHYTTYSTLVLRENIIDAVKILSTMLFRANFGEPQCEIEKKVLRAETLERYEDRISGPKVDLARLIRPGLPVDPKRVDVLNEIHSLTYLRAKSFYERYYKPKNVRIVIAGFMNGDEENRITEMLSHECDPERYDSPPSIVPKYSLGSRRVIADERDRETSHVLIGVPIEIYDSSIP